MPIQASSEQLAAITANIKSNLKVIAVPGSGKSTVLVFRVEYLMKNGIEADKILAVMFNDSAAINFKDDLSKLEFMALPEVRTYHSYARKLGFILEKRGLVKKSNFTPNQHHYKNFYRDSLSAFMPSHLHKRLEVSSNKTLTSFIRFVELCKSSLQNPKTIFEKYKFPITHICYIDIFGQSEALRKSKNIQFFSDLIYDLVISCKENPAILHAVSNMHDVILVDEYQDANAACHALIKIIAGTRAAVNVVGDDDQTIYDFTGASPSFLKEIINEDFSNVQTFALTKTFRFGHTAALIANNIISNNDYRIDKLCISGRPDIKSMITTATYNDVHLDTEQTQLLNEIKNYIFAGGKYNDIAILVRNYSSTFSIELALLKMGIPYYISKESKTVMHSFEMGFLISTAKALCSTTPQAEKSIAITHYLKAYLWLSADIDLSGVVRCVISDEKDLAMNALLDISANIDTDNLKVIKRRVTALISVSKSKNKSVDYRITRLIKEAGILTLLNTRKPYGGVFPLDRFNITLSFFSSLGDTFSSVLDNINNLKAITEQTELNEGIQFCTLHKSKGLAWPYVIMAHCEEGICPSIECGTDPYLIEVERRLFYVGVTRQRSKITFHIPKKDKNLIRSLSKNEGYMNDIYEFRKGFASRFMYETNLLCATTIGVEINKKLNHSAISASGNRHTYNRYLHALGLPYRISGIKDFI